VFEKRAIAVRRSTDTVKSRAAEGQIRSLIAIPPNPPYLADPGPRLRSEQADDAIAVGSSVNRREWSTLNPAPAKSILIATKLNQHAF
jgi:hypothetical protein